MHWLVLNSNDAYDDDHLGFCLRNVSDAASTLSLSLDATLNNCAVAIAVATVDAVKKGGKWNFSRKTDPCMNVFVGGGVGVRGGDNILCDDPKV